ncbi:hypothetical protein V8C37DRAFT_395307 [Trichoderma ceciliae]
MRPPARGRLRLWTLNIRICAALANKSPGGFVPRLLFSPFPLPRCSPWGSGMCVCRAEQPEEQTGGLEKPSEHNQHPSLLCLDPSGLAASWPFPARHQPGVVFSGCREPRRRGKQAVESPTREAPSVDADLGVGTHPHVVAVPELWALHPLPSLYLLWWPLGQKESRRVEHEPRFMHLSSER